MEDTQWRESSTNTDDREETDGLFSIDRRNVMKAAGASAGALVGGGTLLGSATAATADGNCVQVDFVSGSTTLDLDSTNTYSGSGSHDLVAWQWGETVDNQAANGESGDRGTVTGDNSCSVSASSGPTLDFSDYTASVSYDVSGCSGGGTDLLLVSYESPCNGDPSNPQWDPNNADQQDVFDSAFVFDAQDTTGTLIVDIPPLPNDVPQRSSVEAYFPLDDSSAGTNCRNGNNGTIYGDPTSSSGVGGNTNTAFDFDGNSDGTGDALTSGTELPINTESATVAGWIQFDNNSGWNRVFALVPDPETFVSDGVTYQLMRNGTQSKLRWQVHDQNGNKNAVVTDAILNTTDWFFFAAVVNSNDGSKNNPLYMYDTSGELSNSPWTVTQDRLGVDQSEKLTLAAGTDGSDKTRYTNCKMDEVFAFSTALSETEVQDLYDSFNLSG
jgi:hypothetical protein